MGILEDIIAELPSDKLIEQLHMIATQILEEESDNFYYDKRILDYASEGPNVLLTLEVPGRNKKEVGFISLEREGTEVYIVTFSTLPFIEMETKKPDEALPPKRQRVWEVKDHRATRIMTEFAKKVKYLRGE
jgi:hypothetical protein